MKDTAAKRQKAFGVFWNMGMTCLIMVGLVLELGMMFALSMADLLTLRILVLIGIAVCGLLSAVRDGGLLTDMAAPAVLALYSMFRLGGQLFYGAVGMLNRWISLWNTRYEDGRILIERWNVQEKDWKTTLYVLIFLLLALIWHTVRKRKLGRLMAVLVVFALLGLIFGKETVHSVICVSCALIGLWLMKSAEESDPRRLCWMVVLSGTLVLTAYLSNQPMLEIAEGKVWLKERIDRMTYGKDTLAEGDLYHIADMHAEPDQTRLVVRSGQVKDLYLRGFVGDRYDHGRWTKFPRSTYGFANSGMLTWLSDQGFTPQAQYAAYLEAGDSVVTENTVSVNNLRANRRYGYIPYSAQLLPGRKISRQADNGYQNRRFFGQRTYTFTEMGEDLPAELQSVQEWIEDPQNDAQKMYARAEQVYRNFVRENYLDVDEALESLLGDLFAIDKTESSIYNTTVHLRSVLENHAQYEADMADNVPEGEDPILYFLTKAHAGNAALFASTAVQAFRLYGIPARYVEGYCLKKRDMSVEQAVYELTSQQAHAWCEVYMDGIGWIPVDVTPGYYYDTYAMIEMLDASREVIQTSAKEEGDGQADQLFGDEKRAEKEDSLPAQIAHAGSVLYGILVLGLLAVLVLILLLILLRALLVYSITRKWKKASGAKQIKLMCNRIMGMLHAFGLEASVGWRAEETEEQIRAYFPEIEKGEYRGVNAVMEHFYYGGFVLETYETEVIRKFLDKLTALAAHQNLRTQIQYACRDTWNIIRRKEVQR